MLQDTKMAILCIFDTLKVFSIVETQENVLFDNQDIHVVLILQNYSIKPHCLQLYIFLCRI